MVMGGESLQQHTELSSRRFVQQIIEYGTKERIPKGELCINDDVVCLVTGCDKPGFDERLAFVCSLGLDIITLGPCYPFGLDRLPSMADYEWPDLKRWVRETSLFTFAVLDGAFEWGMRILGAEKFFVMLRTSPLSTQELVSATEKLNLAAVERLGAEGINGFILADDIAYQNGLFASPQLLQKFFIPSLARQANDIRIQGLPVFYHSDGNYKQVLNDIVNVGFTGLQCLEKSAGMDIKELQQQLGRKVCLWGHLEVADLTQASNPSYHASLISSIKELSSSGTLILGTTSGLFQGMDIDVLRTIYSTF